MKVRRQRSFASFRVDGERRDITEVLSFLIVLFCYLTTDLISGIFYSLWINIRQTNKQVWSSSPTLLSPVPIHLLSRLQYSYSPCSAIVWIFTTTLSSVSTFQFTFWNDNIVNEKITLRNTESDILINFQFTDEGPGMTEHLSSDHSLFDMVLPAPIKATRMRSPFRANIELRSATNTGFAAIIGQGNCFCRYFLHKLTFPALVLSCSGNGNFPKL